MSVWLQLTAGAAMLLLACDADIGAPSKFADAQQGTVDAPDIDPPADAQQAMPDAAPPVDAQPCVDGDARVLDPTSGHCYILFSAELPWADARDACTALGPTTHLAVTTNQEENDLLVPLVADLVALGQVDFWMGGTDADAEGVWLWITAEPMIYENWRIGEPNDGGSDGDREHCMIIEGDNVAEWDDRPCDRTYGFVCERE